MSEKIIIPLSFIQQRLDHVLVKLFPKYSRSKIQEALSKGQILINGIMAKPNYKIKGEEEITLEIPTPDTPRWEAQPISLEIVFEDDALMVINKPVGMVVHPGAGNANNTLLNALLHHAPGLAHLPRAGILHRLDKDTSGLLVIAKTEEALKHLSQQLKKRTLLREYQAITYGKIISGGTINAAMARHPMQRKRMAVIENGRTAITHYRVAEKYRHHTRLIVRLETGRTHQIRVHLAHIHHPIIGDPTYGGRVKLAKNMAPELIHVIRTFKRQALHAFALGLVHPTTQESLRWEIDLPDDMQALIQLLRADVTRNKS